MPRLRRYGLGARVYDVVSGERLVYRVGRVAGIEALRLSPGDSVLDLGCGTGLNLPLLHQRIGPSGLIVGVDRSEDMLRMARQRVVRNGWSNVRLIQADVADLSWSRLVAEISEHAAIDPHLAAPNSQPDADPPVPLTPDGNPPVPRTPDAPIAVNRPAPLFGATLATYAMSVFDDWHPAWQLMRDGLTPGGRIVIVDMSRPVGVGTLFTPLAVLACALGGADLSAAPWRELEATGTDVAHATFRSGHIHVVAGSFP